MYLYQIYAMYVDQFNVFIITIDDDSHTYVLHRFALRNICID